MDLTFEIPEAGRGEHGAPRRRTVPLTEFVVAGWTGRDADAVEHHIEELRALGIPRPSQVPLFYRVAANQLTQATAIQVVGERTSGEAEPFVFVADGALFVSIASDHTDRELEAHSVALSKQVCVKPVAAQAWAFDEVRGHWDSLRLRSWIVEDGVRTLYQDGTLAQLRPALELLTRYLVDGAAPRDGLAMTCGTVPAIGGIRPSAAFEMELADDRLGRRLTHRYEVQAMPLVS